MYLPIRSFTEIRETAKLTCKKDAGVPRKKKKFPDPRFPMAYPGYPGYPGYPPDPYADPYSRDPYFRLVESYLG